MNIEIIQYSVNKANMGPAVIKFYNIGNKKDIKNAVIQLTIVEIVINLGYKI